MRRDWFAQLFLSFPILALSLPVQANPIGLDSSDLAFWAQTDPHQVIQALPPTILAPSSEVRVNTLPFGEVMR